MSATVEVLPLGQVVKPVRPRVKPAEYADLPFIGMEHIEAHSMKLLGTVPAGTMKSSAIYFKPGDVLYGRLRPYLNKVYRPTFEGLCSAEFIVLPENERVDGAYLQYFLNSSAFVRYASHLNAGDRPRVDFDQLAPYEIPLPDKSDQRHIVAEIEKQFSRLDEAVANLKRVKANLKRYKAAVLKAAVEGRLVPTEAGSAQQEGRSCESADELMQRILDDRASGRPEGSGNKGGPTALGDADELLSLPQGWAWATLDQIGQEGRPVIYGIIKPGPDTAGGVPYVRVMEMKDGFIDLLSLRRAARERETKFARARLRAGDLLISKDGTIGRVAVVPLQLEGGNITQHVMRAPIHRFMNRDFVMWAIRSELCQRWLTGETRGVALRGVNVEDFRRLPIPIPPIAEQHRIVAEIDRRVSIVREVEVEADANLQRAQALRQAVLAATFR